MNLPFEPPFPPMEAKRVETIPKGEGWQFEPKWDGFRVIVYRDGDDVYLQSKAGQPLSRYFPELVEAVKECGDPRFVLDGEIVLPAQGRLSFDDLQLRLHPAESRVRKLAAQIPATIVAFDLLAFSEGKKQVDLRSEELAVRRARLERWLETNPSSRIGLSLATSDRQEALRWQSSLSGIGLDGVMAKRLDQPYRSGERTAMQKVKALKDADCVIGGVRHREGTQEVAVIMLGLYDDGKLRHVGNISSMTVALRKEVSELLAPLTGRGGFDDATLGGPSRWSNTKESKTTEPVPVEPKLVVEVRYDYFNQGRFRHGAKFMRWRPDKKPEDCTIEQVTPADGDPSLVGAVLNNTTE